MDKDSILQQIRHGLIVSCQALPDEPLHSPYIMGRMAYAAYEGGAVGIRANTPEDIRAIKKTVHLPVIGLYKVNYSDSDVYITPTMKELDELAASEPEIIAMDATNRPRPQKLSLEEFFLAAKEKYPNQLFMADTACFEEGVNAWKLGFDLVGTTLSGYTAYTKSAESPDYALMRRYVDELPIPIVAEGGIGSPEQLKKAFEQGIWTAVVGTAITRPREITKGFVDAILAF